MIKQDKGGRGRMIKAEELLDKIRSQNEVYNALKYQILTLKAEPGEMLSENIISAQMNAGRSAVRDALAQLTEEGYVVVYPQKGTAVSMIDPERIKQSVYTHRVLEQSMIEEICRSDISEEQLKLLEDVLDEQSIKKEEIADLLILEQQLSYALSVLCDKKHIWEMFRIMDCDMLRANYLYYSTYGFQAERYYGPSGWEHMQIEGRMLLDHLNRKDTEAAALICSSHFDRILLNTNSIQGFYPQFFSG